MWQILPNKKSKFFILSILSATRSLQSTGFGVPQEGTDTQADIATYRQIGLFGAYSVIYFIYKFLCASLVKITL